MLRYEQKSEIFETNTVSIVTVPNIESYNNCLKCSLSALTQVHNHFAICLLLC